MGSRSDFSIVGQLQDDSFDLVPNRKLYHKQIYIKECQITKFINTTNVCFRMDRELILIPKSLQV